ncbi:hypothetical protein SKAU_G00251720 [Synaphobranchus kaupii]|uniref:Uncharacterized protein n=1 Tax=Synaphobranchus kaupii TaxID=118154 RepID=A0A9Q1F3D3_SYNKA|nr:hypothetical protein SKAU_G00251720 [Synaphobranchus kaupii]
MSVLRASGQGGKISSGVEQFSVAFRPRREPFVALQTPPAKQPLIYGLSDRRLSRQLKVAHCSGSPSLPCLSVPGFAVPAELILPCFQYASVLLAYVAVEGLLPVNVAVTV